MEFLSNIGLQEIGIAGAITILLLREILRFVQGLMAIKGKQDRREVSCPLAKHSEESGTLEWYKFKRDLDIRMKKIEEKIK